MKKTKKFVIILVLSFAATALLAGQGLEDFSLHIQPGIDLPLGSRSFLTGETGAFQLSGTAALRGQYRLSALPLVYLEAALNGGFHPTPAEDLLLTSLGGGAGLDFRIADTLSLQLGAEAGITLGFYGAQPPAANPYGGGRAGLIWDITPSFGFSAGGTYRFHLGYDQLDSAYTDLYQGTSAWIGLVMRFNPDTGRQKIDIEESRVEPVFPVFYSYYEQNPLGEIRLRNNENSSISNVDVYFYAGEYMEQPMLSATIPRIERDSSAAIDIYALFSNKILHLTETSKVSSEIRVKYTYLGERFTYTYPYTLKVLDRNSMTWDDDRKAASFVTPRDPTVLLFSKNTAGLVREQGNNPLNLNFRIAMCLYETLRLYGMNYVIDPQSSYIEASQDQVFLDYLQFPSQSLTFRAGDCDDLSILYSALLESVGIETAFITIPGHIYMAFSLGITEKEARKEFTNTDDFIFLEDRTWVPVETTLIQEGFLKAFRTGAKQWRDNVAKNSAAFYPIHRAWETYQPVSFAANALSLLFPSPDSIINSYNTNLEAFVTQEIQEKVEYFTQRIRTKGDSPSLRNRFGILYARYGLLEKAMTQFQQALRLDRNYASAMLNAGNIHFLREEYPAALELYRKAAGHDPDNPYIMAGLARAHFEMEEFPDAQSSYRELARMAPEVAADYAYIGNSNTVLSRASAAKDKGRTYWGEPGEMEE